MSCIWYKTTFVTSVQEIQREWSTFLLLLLLRPLGHRDVVNVKAPSMGHIVLFKNNSGLIWPFVKNNIKKQQHKNVNINTIP